MKTTRKQIIGTTSDDMLTVNVKPTKNCLNMGYDSMYYLINNITMTIDLIYSGTFSHTQRAKSYTLGLFPNFVEFTNEEKRKFDNAVKRIQIKKI